MDFARENKRIDKQLDAGLDKFYANDYEGAFLEFDAVLLLDEDDAMANSFAGACLAQFGRFDEAEPLVRKGVALAPQAMLAHVFLSEVLWATKRYDEAESELWEALAREPHNPEMNYQLGRFLHLHGDPQKARERFERAIELKPDHVTAHYLLGLSLGNAGEYDQAIREMARVIELQPRFEGAYAYSSAICLVRNRDSKDKRVKLQGFKQAQAALRRAVELNPANEEISKQLARVNRGVQELEYALGKWQRVRKAAFRSLLIAAALGVLFSGREGFLHPVTVLVAIIGIGMGIAMAWGKRKAMQSSKNGLAASGIVGLNLPDPYAKSNQRDKTDSPEVK